MMRIIFEASNRSDFANSRMNAAESGTGIKKNEGMPFPIGAATMQCMEQDHNLMQLDALCDHIENTHHVYVRQALASIELLLVQLKEQHGREEPNLARILRGFRSVADELSIHMQKEEHILFPYIRKLDRSWRNRTELPTAHFPSIALPISVMEKEHRHTDRAMQDIRRHTSAYRIPQKAGKTWIEAYRELEVFDADLRQHLHLENNILFPKAINLEAQLNGNR